MTSTSTGDTVYSRLKLYVEPYACNGAELPTKSHCYNFLNGPAMYNKVTTHLLIHIRVRAFDRYAVCLCNHDVQCDELIHSSKMLPLVLFFAHFKVITTTLNLLLSPAEAVSARTSPSTCSSTKSPSTSATSAAARSVTSRTKSFTSNGT